MSKKTQHLKPASVIFNESGEPYSLDFNDVFFQKNCGIAESCHVFVQGNSLPERFKALDNSVKACFIIFEIGFGTGLNFLTTLEAWRKNAPASWSLHYLSVEKHPLNKSCLKKTLQNLSPLPHCNELIDNYPALIAGTHRIDIGNIRLNLLFGDALDMVGSLMVSNHNDVASQLKPYVFDAIFLDGFAPSKNPELWNKDLLKKIASLCDTNTTITTFSVARSVKESLCESGFRIEKKKGFGKKREMLYGRYISNKQSMPKIEKASRYSTPWHVGKPKSRTNSKYKTIVIGAGIAGCAVSYQLARTGHSVCLLDTNSSVAQGASGNPYGILDIKISPFPNPQYLLLLESYLYALNFYKELKLMSLYGMMRIDKSTEIPIAYQEIAENVAGEQERGLSGLNFDRPATYFPGSGVISPQNLCHSLIQFDKVNFVKGVTVKNIQRQNNKWIVEGVEADNVVVACGDKSNEFYQTNSIPLTGNNGLLSLVKANQLSRELKVPLSKKGYILPAIDGMHVIGGSYGVDKSRRASAHQNNIKLVSEMHSSFNFSIDDVIGERFATRAVTLDRLPLVGLVPIRHQFLNQFKLLRLDANTFVPCSGEYLPNLYLMAGFGSSGLTLIPKASLHIASLINSEPSPFSTEMQRNIAPARFLIKHLVKNRV